MTETTTRKPRKREPKVKAAVSYSIGAFSINIEDGVYRITSGNSLLVRTTDAGYFKDYCALLEKSVK